MASVSGLDANAIIKVATTWGTPVAGGAGNKFAGEITPNFNVQELIARAIGSGQQMAYTATIGNYLPTISLVGDTGYRNNWDVILAQFMGTSAAPTEVTVSQADYRHAIIFNPTLNAKYLTLAWEDSTTTTLEFPTCGVQSFGLKTNNIPGYLECSAELIAGVANFSSATNTNATLQAATWTEGTPELTACAFDDYIWRNAQSGGAVSSGDVLPITGFDLQLQRPQEIRGEMKGAAGNSAPLKNGQFSGTLSLTLKELADHTYYTIWSAFTSSKAKISVEGTQIGSGTNKAWVAYLTSLAMVTEPKNPLTSEGVNPQTLEFRLLKPGTAPTGMTTSAYPYFNITNGLSTSLLA